MCAGFLPFADEGELLNQKIVSGSWSAPPFFSPNLTSLLSHLMVNQTILGRKEI
jgi:hypothetical protein